MKVVLAHPVDPSSPKEGGAIRYVYELAKYLVQNSQVHITLLGKKEQGSGPNVNLDLDFVPIANGWDPWYIYLIKLMLKIPFLNIHKSAIIHTCRFDYMIPFILLCTNNPKVLTSDEPLHYLKLNHPIFYKPLALVYHLAEAWCLKWKIDWLITDARTAKKYYEKRYPWLKAKLKIIPTSGVDLRKFKPMDRRRKREEFMFNSEKIVMSIGRIAKVKSIDFLIRSFSIVKQQIPEATLVIIGRGDRKLQTELELLAKELGLRDILFTGEIQPNKIPEILNCANVLALCSISEGSPTVVREAIACGVPVVSTDVGDVRHVIKSPSICKIVERDENMFAKALIEFLNKDIEQIKRECAKISAIFSLTNIFQEVIEVYKSLVPSN